MSKQLCDTPDRQTDKTDGQHAMALPAPLLLHGAGRNSTYFLALVLLGRKDRQTDRWTAYDDTTCATNIAWHRSGA